MNVGLRVLIIEDSSLDAELMIQTLRRGGFEHLIAERVETPEAMQAAINRQTWDVILADHALPRFSALSALALLKERGQELPFIIVSGRLDETQAVAVMQAGAYDYVSKQHLTRLAPAVERSLREAEARRERRRAEETMRASEARYRAVVESQTDLICRYLPDGTLTFVNQAFCRFFGRPSADLIGKRREIDILPEDAVFVTRKRQRLSPQHPTVSCWHRTRLPGGEIRWLHWTDHAFYDANGNLTEIQSVGQDITERMQADAALKQRNQELQALNAIAAGIHQALTPAEIANAALDKILSVLGADGGCIHLTDESGSVPALQLIAQRGLTPAAAAALHTLNFDAHLLQPAPADDDAPGLPTGHVLAALQSGLPAIDAEPAPAIFCVPLRSLDHMVGALSIFKYRPDDRLHNARQLLTTIGYQIGAAVENLRLAQKASEMEVLREVDRLRAELIANVSHELRTPLGLITIMCTTLLREDAQIDPETQQEFLRDIEEEARNLEKIVDNLLDASRLQSGRLRLNKRLTDIGRLVRETLESLRPQLTRHNFVCDLPPQPMVTMADSKRLEQVLRNLLSNAMKYSPAGGPITVQGQPTEKEIIVRVSDRGIGIQADDLERVFERFYRVEDESTYNVPGIGLGLSICRGLVEAHGGRIWAESTPGIGSTFTFTLPIERSETMTG